MRRGRESKQKMAFEESFENVAKVAFNHLMVNDPQRVADILTRYMVYDCHAHEKMHEVDALGEVARIASKAVCSLRSDEDDRSAIEACVSASASREASRIVDVALAAIRRRDPLGSIERWHARERVRLLAGSKWMFAFFDRLLPTKRSVWISTCSTLRIDRFYYSFLRLESDGEIERWIMYIEINRDALKRILRVETEATIGDWNSRSILALYEEATSTISAMLPVAERRIARVEAYMVGLSAKKNKIFVWNDGKEKHAIWQKKPLNVEYIEDFVADAKKTWSESKKTLWRVFDYVAPLNYMTIEYKFSLDYASLYNEEGRKLSRDWGYRFVENDPSGANRTFEVDLSKRDDVDVEDRFGEYILIKRKNAVVDDRCRYAIAPAYPSYIYFMYLRRHDSDTVIGMLPVIPKAHFETTYGFESASRYLEKATLDGWIAFIEQRAVTWKASRA